jgi:hypothetical protein
MSLPWFFLRSILLPDIPSLVHRTFTAVRAIKPLRSPNNKTLSRSSRQYGNKMALDVLLFTEVVLTTKTYLQTKVDTILGAPFEEKNIPPVRLLCRR